MKKRKPFKKTKSAQSRTKMMIMRPTDNDMSSDYQHSKITVEEFTAARSLRISKERFDIVESRTLCTNVIKF